MEQHISTEQHKNRAPLNRALLQRKYPTRQSLSLKMEVHVYEFTSAVRGFHVYRHYWRPKEGEILSTRRDTKNLHDRTAVAVKLGKVTVGHLPAEFSRIAWFFIHNGGSIACQITSARRRRSNIAKGGLEIPCTYIFHGKKRYTSQLSHLLQESVR